MDTLPFYLFLFMHLVSLIVGFGAVVVIDTFGLLMLLRRVSLPLMKQVAETTQRLIWLGWGGLVISGINLLIIKGYVDNLTKIKLFFVILLGLNGICLHFIKKALNHYDRVQDIPPIHNFRIGLSSAVSQMGWWGAITIGFVHRHWRHNIPWPENYGAVIGVILLAIGIILLTGELLFRPKKKRH